MDWIWTPVTKTGPQDSICKAVGHLQANNRPTTTGKAESNRLTDGEPRTQRMTHLKPPFAHARRQAVAAGALETAVPEITHDPGHQHNGADASGSSSPSAPVVRTPQDRFSLFPHVQPNSRLVSTLQSFAK